MNENLHKCETPVRFHDMMIGIFSTATLLKIVKNDYLPGCREAVRSLAHSNPLCFSSDLTLLPIQCMLGNIHFQVVKPNHVCHQFVVVYFHIPEFVLQWLQNRNLFP